MGSTIPLSMELLGVQDADRAARGLYLQAFLAMILLTACGVIGTLSSMKDRQVSMKQVPHCTEDYLSVPLKSLDFETIYPSQQKNYAHFQGNIFAWVPIGITPDERDQFYVEVVRESGSDESTLGGAVDFFYGVQSPENLLSDQHLFQYVQDGILPTAVQYTVLSPTHGTGIKALVHIEDDHVVVACENAE